MIIEVVSSARRHTLDQLSAYTWFIPTSVCGIDSGEPNASSVNST